MNFVKSGARVEAEAAALEAARHPGVVELVDVVDGALRTVRVDGRSLADLPPMGADEVAGVTAAVATTLGDLHELGVTHGGIEAGHVLVGADGRILLCSLGRGGEPADDVAALGRLVADLLAAVAATPPRPEGHLRWIGRRDRERPARLGSLLAPPAAGTPPRSEGHRRWIGRRDRERPARLGSLLAPPAAPELQALAARAVDPDPARRPTARQVASEVHRRIPTARLPALPTGGPPLPLAPSVEPSRRAVVAGAARGVALAAVVVVALGAAVFAVDRMVAGGPPRVPLRRPAGPASTALPAPADAPVAERVWPEPALHYEAGVLTVDGARYALGEPGDAVVAGDWACTGRRTVALLRPGSGEVFAFDGWAHEGAELAGRPLGAVEGGAGLRVTDGDGDGCDDLEVVRANRSPVPVAVGARPVAVGARR